MSEWFHQLQWRLDAPIATRSCSTSTELPHYTIRLVCETEQGPKERWISCDMASLVNLSKSVDDAVAALRTPQYRRINKMVK